MRKGFKEKTPEFVEKEIETILEIFNFFTDKCYFRILIEKK